MKKKARRRCACCFCGDVSQDATESLHYPMALAYCYKKEWYAAWLERESDGCLRVLTCHGRFFTVLEAEEVLGVALHAKVRLGDREGLALPLRNLRSPAFRRITKERPGEVCRCSAELRCADVDRLSVTHPHLLSATRSDLTLGSKRRRRAEGLCLGCLPFGEWTQEAFQQYFQSEKEHDHANDPLLKKIRGIQYHSIGLPRFECEWQHPSGKTARFFHRGGELRSNPTYLRMMLEYQRRHPDRSSDFDVFE